MHAGVQYQLTRWWIRVTIWLSDGSSIIFCIELLFWALLTEDGLCPVHPFVEYRDSTTGETTGGSNFGNWSLMLGHTIPEFSEGNSAFWNSSGSVQPLLIRDHVQQLTDQRLKRHAQKLASAHAARLKAKEAALVQARKEVALAQEVALDQSRSRAKKKWPDDEEQLSKEPDQEAVFRTIQRQGTAIMNTRFQNLMQSFA